MKGYQFLLSFLFHIIVYFKWMTNEMQKNVIIRWKPKKNIFI